MVSLHGNRIVTKIIPLKELLRLWPLLVSLCCLATILWAALSEILFPITMLCHSRSPKAKWSIQTVRILPGKSTQLQICCLRHILNPKENWQTQNPCDRKWSSGTQNIISHKMNDNRLSRWLRGKCTCHQF